MPFRRIDVAPIQFTIREIPVDNEDVGDHVSRVCHHDLAIWLHREFARISPARRLPRLLQNWNPAPPALP